MSRGRPEKRVPVTYGVDSGKQLTTREVAQRMAEFCDVGDGIGASDVIDELFIFGAWAHVLARDDGDGAEEEPRDMLRCRRNIRSLVRAAYKVGCERERERCWLECRAAEKDLATVGGGGVPLGPTERLLQASGANACVQRLRAMGKTP